MSVVWIIGLILIGIVVGVLAALGVRAYLKHRKVSARTKVRTLARRNSSLSRQLKDQRESSSFWAKQSLDRIEMVGQFDLDKVIATIYEVKSKVDGLGTRLEVISSKIPDPNAAKIDASGKVIKPNPVQSKIPEFNVATGDKIVSINADAQADALRKLAEVE